MSITYLYAFVVGIVMSAIVLIGCMFGKRSFVLTGMIFSAIVGSPVITFTRGAAGAIYASDMVSFVLLICWWFPSTKSFICELTPRWYKPFFRLMMLAVVSVILVGPLFSGGIAGAGLAENVSVSIRGIPLPILMAGFRFVRIILYVVYFVYAAHMIMDEKTFRFVCKLITVGVVILAVCQILNFFGVAELGLASREVEWQHSAILGHSKAAGGRLYLVGIFVTLILIYGRWSAPIYFVFLATIGMGLLFSGSRAAFVAMLVGVFILAMRARFLGKMLVLLLAALVPLGFYVLARLDPERMRIESFLRVITDPTTNPRWIVWGWIIPYIATHPVIWLSGVGFSNFRYALVTEYIGAQAEHAHNDFLTCLTEMGFLGLAFFISYIYRLGKSVFSRVRHTTGEPHWQAICLSVVFAVYLVSSLFESTLYFAVTTTSMQRIAIVLFGAATSLWVQQDYEAAAADEMGYELLDADSVFEDTYA
jgi:O-antigen ligase